MSGWSCYALLVLHQQSMSLAFPTSGAPISGIIISPLSGPVPDRLAILANDRAGNPVGGDIACDVVQDVDDLLGEVSALELLAFTS